MRPAFKASWCMRKALLKSFAESGGAIKKCMPSDNGCTLPAGRMNGKKSVKLNTFTGQNLSSEFYS